MEAISEQTDLSGYEVKLIQGYMGQWTYEITTPDDDLLNNAGGLYMSKLNAKKEALRVIERHQRTETLDGNTLRNQLQ